MKAVPDLPGFNLNFKHGNADFFVNLIVMAACYLSALVLLSTCVHVRKARVQVLQTLLDLHNQHLRSFSTSIAPEITFSKKDRAPYVEQTNEDGQLDFPNFVAHGSVEDEHLLTAMHPIVDEKYEPDEMAGSALRLPVHSTDFKATIHRLAAGDLQPLAVREREALLLAVQYRLAEKHAVTRSKDRVERELQHM
eukprot:1160193-Pelagomonas_calceolata.AAC.2